MSQQEVIDYLRKENKPKTSKEIKIALDKAEANTQRILRQLTREGLINRVHKNKGHKTFIYSINHNA
jgi:predicted transcriptional regulator